MENKTSYFLVLMMTIIVLMTVIILTSSCSVIPRYNTEGVNLKQGGEISKDYTQCKLIRVYRCAKGWHHLFQKENSVILIRHYNVKMQVDSCYYIHN